MTNEKPKPEVQKVMDGLIEDTAESLFDMYAKDWAGDNDTRPWEEIDEEEMREWRETAKELLTPAYEQGKLELMELLEKEVNRMHKERNKHKKTMGDKFSFYRGMKIGEIRNIEWLKSQLKEGEKR